MRVVVIRHHNEDYPGLIEEAFRARGAELITHLFLNGGELPSLDGVDHVVLLGAMPSVNDDGPGFEWIGQELDWLRRAEEARVPVLGICFGAQALCVAFGGKVEEMPAKEIGWKVIKSADLELIPAGPWLDFHGDHCLPPPGGDDPGDQRPVRPGVRARAASGGAVPSGGRRGSVRGLATQRGQPRGRCRWSGPRRPPRAGVRRGAGGATAGRPAGGERAAGGGAGGRGSLLDRAARCPQVIAEGQRRVVFAGG